MLGILVGFLAGLVGYFLIPAIITLIIYLCLGKKMKAKLKKKIVIWSFVILSIVEFIVLCLFRSRFISG